MSIFRNEGEVRKFAEYLMKESRQVTEASEPPDGGYRSDKERREMVKELRKVEAEHIQAVRDGDSRTAAEKEKRAKQLIEELFKEVELMIYKLADDLTSGPNSRRSQYKEGGNAFNDAEDLKVAGVIEFIRIVEGGRGRINPDGTLNLDFKGNESFDPDGPGTFASFVWKSVNGVMLNCHSKEAKHRADVSLNAPVGKDETAEFGDFLYNDVLGRGKHFDFIGEDENRKFVNSDAFKYLMKIVKDVTSGSARQLEIFNCYYGVNGCDKMTPTQIAAKLGVSKQYVNNTVTQVMARIDAYLIDESEIDGYVLRLTDEEGRVTWASNPKSYKGQAAEMKDATYLSNRQLKTAVPYWEGKGFTVKAFNIDQPISESAGDVGGSGSRIKVVVDGRTMWSSRHRPTLMTSRESDAAVLSGKELEDVLRFFSGLASETEYGKSHGMSVEEVPENSLKESEEDEQEKSALDGRTLKQARNDLVRIWKNMPKEAIYRDQGWAPVFQFYRLLDEKGIARSTVESKYEQNSDGRLSSKRWTIDFPFVNQIGKKVKVTGTLVACGAGTVEDPLSAYDVLFYVF